MVMPNVPTPAVPQGLLDKILGMFGGGGDSDLSSFMDSRAPGATDELPGNSPLFGGSATASPIVAEFLQAVREGTVDAFFEKHGDITVAELQELQAALAGAPAEEGLGNPKVQEKARAGELGDQMSERANAITDDAKAEASTKIDEQAQRRGAMPLLKDATSLNDAWLKLKENDEFDMPFSRFKELNKGVVGQDGKIPAGSFFVTTDTGAPAGSRQYTTKDGDTPASIAEYLKADVNDIMAQLGVDDPNERLGKDQTIELAPPPARGETRGEQTMPPASGAPLTPGTPGAPASGVIDSARPEYDTLYEQDPDLLIQALIGSKNYAPGYAANKRSEFDLLQFLDSLKYTLDPGSVPEGGTGTRLADMFGAGQTYDSGALLQQALTDPEYRGAFESPTDQNGAPNEQLSQEVASLLFGLRSQSLPDEALSVYQGGYIDKLYYDYVQQTQGQEGAPSFLQFLVEKGL